MIVKTIAISTATFGAFISLVSACLSTDSSDDGDKQTASDTMPGDDPLTLDQIAKAIVVKPGCKLTDITQGPQTGPMTYTPPGLFQNNGPAAPVDGVEQGNAGKLGGKGSLKCLHGGPGSTGEPLPTNGQIGGMTLPVIDSVCFAASPGANGCSVLAVECAQTGGAGGAAAGQVYACTGSVYVQNGAEYCDGTWYGCDGKPLAIPMNVGGLQLTQGNGAPKGGWYGKCGGDTLPDPGPGPGIPVDPTITTSAATF